MVTSESINIQNFSTNIVVSYLCVRNPFIKFQFTVWSGQYLITHIRDSSLSHTHSHTHDWANTFYFHSFFPYKLIDGLFIRWILVESTFFLDFYFICGSYVSPKIHGFQKDASLRLHISFIGDELPLTRKTLGRNKERWNISKCYPFPWLSVPSSHLQVIRQYDSHTSNYLPMAFKQMQMTLIHRSIPKEKSIAI